MKILTQKVSWLKEDNDEFLIIATPSLFKGRSGFVLMILIPLTRAEENNRHMCTNIMLFTKMFYKQFYKPLQTPIKSLLHVNRTQKTLQLLFLEYFSMYSYSKATIKFSHIYHYYVCKSSNHLLN